MNRKIIYFFLIIFLSSFKNTLSNEIDLKGKFIPLKDFILLKYDLFINNNLSNLISGGGITHVAYQSIQYDVLLDKKNNIKININAIMNKKRYKSKKYYPKIRDCNEIRNKIFMNKSGYSFFKKTYNNLVNEDTLSLAVKNNILNISSLDSKLTEELLENTFINIEIIHPISDKNLSCSGKLISSKLK